MPPSGKSVVGAPGFLPSLKVAAPFETRYPSVMRCFLTIASLLLAIGPVIAAEDVPVSLTIKIGTIRNSEGGVKVNFAITNGDADTIGIVFTTCTALDVDGQPKAKADENVHNVRPGETAFGQAQFEEGEATTKDRFTCRIEQISR